MEEKSLFFRASERGDWEVISQKGEEGELPFLWEERGGIGRPDHQLGLILGLDPPENAEKTSSRP